MSGTVTLREHIPGHSVSPLVGAYIYGDMVTDPRWVRVDWLDEQGQPVEWCVGWLERGWLFVPNNGQSGAELYDPEGPMPANRINAPMPNGSAPPGHIREERAYDWVTRRWYCLHTGTPARWRAKAGQMAPTKSGAIRQGPVCL